MSELNKSRFLVKPGTKIHLSEFDPDDTSLMPDKKKGEARIPQQLEALEELQARLYANNKQSVLIVLQGMDAAGKDGTIKHVMSGLNPQGCSVVSFKQPSTEEMNHDFLWRIERAMPRKGQIGVFNRSHYEDVLIVRVHKMVPPDVWKERYNQINRFEQLLSELGTIVLKFFLHISKDEQKKRLEQRLEDPSKNWKFSKADVKERELWDQYQRAYEDVLTKCSTQSAPWYIIPANHKWYRNWMVGRAIAEKLESLDLKYPPPAADLSKIRFT